MTYKVSVAIPVAYPEEIVFLRGNIAYIESHKHPEIETEIIICDQTGVGDIKSEFGRYKVVTVQRVDAGYPLDVAVRQAEGQYFTSLDVDCAPLHEAWLYAPVKVLDTYPDVCMVGKATGLHNHHDYAKWGAFFHINNYYRTMRAEQARYVSQQVGFLRPENRAKADFYPVADFPFEANCDNGVRANSFTDKIKMGKKFSIAMNKILGMTNEMGVFGMVLDGLVFHMVFSSSKDWISDKSKTLGDDYMSWYSRINAEGFEAVLPEMIAALKPKYEILYDRHLWDGTKEIQLTPQDDLFRNFSAWKKEGIQ